MSDGGGDCGGGDCGGGDCGGGDSGGGADCGGGDSGGGGHCDSGDSGGGGHCDGGNSGGSGHFGGDDINAGHTFHNPSGFNAHHNWSSDFASTEPTYNNSSRSSRQIMTGHSNHRGNATGSHNKSGGKFCVHCFCSMLIVAGIIGFIIYMTTRNSSPAY